MSKIKDSSIKMGVMIQEKINADFAGVIFSANLLTYSKEQMIISYTSGISNKLVSGLESGTDIVVSVSDDNFIIDDNIACSLRESLICLAYKTKALKTKEKYPINVEWAIQDNEIFFLQCRPLASITKIQNTLEFVNKQNHY